MSYVLFLQEAMKVLFEQMGNTKLESLQGVGREPGLFGMLQLKA
jgi:hypothetical protein